MVRERHRILHIDGDTLFTAGVALFLIVTTLLVLYPLIFILSASFSSPSAVISGKVILWPVDIGLEGYIAVFKNNNIANGFMNSSIYTLTGTILSVALTLMAAYPLAQKNLPLGNAIMFIFTFTMIFSGGMIPSYLLVSSLGMLNTIWSMILPGAIAVYNLIITRTFIQGIPDSLKEASEIDGCSDIKYFFYVIIPLSPAIIAVLTLFYAVDNWGNYFSAFLYLTNRKLYPLQIILREILLMNQILENSIADSESAMRVAGMAELLKYSLIVISSLPMLIIFPFIQKYFIKGVMIGSIKG